MASDISDLIEAYAQRLECVGVLNAREEARLILEKTLKDGTNIDKEGKEALECAFRLREQRMPIERIFGVADFCGLTLHMDENVYKPYPETEDLVHYALASLGETKKDIRILDLGTGTGCILLALLHALPRASGVGIDISERALDLARLNAKENGLVGRADFRIGNWGSGLSEKFDLVISNPPRAPSAFLPHLLPEMRNYDPPNSLDGGEDGLDFVRVVAQDFKRLSNDEALCLCQLGPVYASNVARIFKKAGFKDLRIMGNFTGEPCCILVKKEPENSSFKSRIACLGRQYFRRLFACFSSQH